MAVRLTASQDEEFGTCIIEKKQSQKYNILVTNCTSVAHKYFASFDFEQSVSPVGFQLELIESGAISSPQWYRPSK